MEDHRRTIPEFLDPDDLWDMPSQLPILPTYHAEPVYGGARLATIQELQQIMTGTGAPGAGLALPHCSLLGTVEGRAARRGEVGSGMVRDGMGILAAGHAFAPDTRTRLLHDRSIWLPDRLLHRHLLAVGPLGSGKTMRLVFPLAAAAVARADSTVVILDPKAELFRPLRRIAIAAGRSPRAVLRLNLLDPRRSIGWSPVARDVDRGRAFAVAHPLAMASHNPASNDSMFWVQSATELYVAILCALGRERRASLPLLREVLDLPRRELLQWLDARGATVPEVASFQQFLASGSHNAETVLADARARLTPLVDERVAAVLSHPDLDLRAVFRRPRVLIIEMPETSLGRLRPLYGLLASQLLDAAIQVADSSGRAALPHPATLIVDELGNLGPIPDFPVRLNTLRSRRLGVIGAVQTLEQLAATYGPTTGAVLTGFASKVFLPGVEPADAAYASERTGTTTVRISPRSDLPVARPLLTPEEVIRPRRHPILGRPMTFLLADEAPFQGWIRPAFERDDLRPALACPDLRGPARRHPLQRERLASGVPAEPGAPRRP